MILDNHTEACPGDDCAREGCAELPENVGHYAGLTDEEWHDMPLTGTDELDS